MRILLMCESESGGTVEPTLRSQGFQVSTTGLGEECVSREACFDLILVNMDRVHRGSAKILRRVREQTAGTPIMMLSPEANPVRALADGADDYLIKPFDGRELIARIHALIRRSKGRTAAGRFVLNPTTMSVTIDGAAVHLTPKEYQLLAALLEPGGQSSLPEPSGKQQPPAKGADVRRLVCTVRKKLCAAAETSDFIETMWGRGYAFRQQCLPERIGKTSR